LGGIIRPCGDLVFQRNQFFFHIMINKVTLIGRLGGDPEIRHLEGGVAVARFSLATNDSYKDKDGNWQDSTEWHNVVVWRDLAERASTQLKKGNLCYIEGKIQYRKYTGTDGVERNITDIAASTFRMMERREGAGQDARMPNEVPPNINPTGGGSSTTSANTPPPPPQDQPGDDLPF
jgi:single-strand DNA-binding protein